MCLHLCYEKSIPVVTEGVKDQSVKDPETGTRTIKTREIRHRWFTPQEAAKRVKRWAKKAGYDPKWFSPKSLRKSHISWLVKVYPDREGDIMLSVGHDLLTDIRYYRGTPFTEDEIVAYKKYMNEWS